MMLETKANRKTLSQVRKQYARWVQNTKESKILRATLFALAEGDCPVCGKPMVLRFDDYRGWDLATLDHTIPLSIILEHKKVGYQIMCRLCNNKKGNKIE